MNNAIGQVYYMWPKYYLDRIYDSILTIVCVKIFVGLAICSFRFVFRYEK